MTPIEVSDSNEEHSANYSGEAKTENLVLCSGLGALHNHKLNAAKSSHPVATEVRFPASNNRLAALRGIEGRMGGRVRRNGVHQKPSPLSDENFPSLKKPTGLSCNPLMVKVSVYTKAVNPYVVIYDSNKKYAKPVICLKLMNCIVKAGGPQHRNQEVDNNNDDDDCLFRIFSNKHEDVDSAGAITLRAPSSEKRDEWVQYLNAVTNGSDGNSESITGYIPGSSVLPTLLEQDDNLVEGETDTSSDNIKSPSRKMREGRRSSLNSLGIRLRCYSFGKNR